MMRNDLEFLGFLASGEPVFDRPNSHLHSGVRELLPEVFAGIFGSERFMAREYNFSRVVGQTTCVATSSGDQIVYAQRLKRAGLTRFVKNRQPELSSSAAVILKKDDYEDYYILITAFIGKLSGPEPWDPRATDEDREFWSTHALIYGSEETIPGTETLYCPW